MLSHGIQFHKPEHGKNKREDIWCDSPFLCTAAAHCPHACHSRTSESHTFLHPIVAHHMYALILTAKSSADLIVDRIMEELFLALSTKPLDRQPQPGLCLLQ